MPNTWSRNGPCSTEETLSGGGRANVLGFPSAESDDVLFGAFEEPLELIGLRKSCIFRMFTLKAWSGSSCYHARRSIQWKDRTRLENAMNGDARGGGAHLMMIDDGSAVDRVGRPLLALKSWRNIYVRTPQGGLLLSMRAIGDRPHDWTGEWMRGPSLPEGKPPNALLKNSGG